MEISSNNLLINRAAITQQASGLNLVTSVSKASPAETSTSTPSVNPEYSPSVDTSENTESAERTREELRESIDNLNAQNEQNGTNIKFGFDRDASVFYVGVYERDTDRLIRTIPSEEAIELLKNNREQTAQIFDQRA